MAERQVVKYKLF